MHTINNDMDATQKQKNNWNSWNDSSFSTENIFYSSYHRVVQPPRKANFKQPIRTVRSKPVPVTVGLVAPVYNTFASYPSIKDLKQRNQPNLEVSKSSASSTNKTNMSHKQQSSKQSALSAQSKPSDQSLLQFSTQDPTSGTSRSQLRSDQSGGQTNQSKQSSKTNQTNQTSQSSGSSHVRLVSGSNIANVANVASVAGTGWSRETRMLYDIHVPETSDDLLGNREEWKQFSDWLRRRTHDRFQVQSKSTDGSSLGDPVFIFLSGPPGVGKSIGAKLLLKEAGFQTQEHNMSLVQSAEDLKLILLPLTTTPLKEAKQKYPPALLLDDLDGASVGFQEKKQLVQLQAPCDFDSESTHSGQVKAPRATKLNIVAGLIDFIRMMVDPEALRKQPYLNQDQQQEASRKPPPNAAAVTIHRFMYPLICICNSTENEDLRILAKYALHIRLKPISSFDMFKFVNRINDYHQLNISAEDRDSLVAQSMGDARRLTMLIDMFYNKRRSSPNAQSLQDYCRETSKNDIQMDPFQLGKRILIHRERLPAFPLLITMCEGAGHDVLPWLLNHNSLMLIESASQSYAGKKISAIDWLDDFMKMAHDSSDIDLLSSRFDTDDTVMQQIHEESSGMMSLSCRLHTSRAREILNNKQPFQFQFPQALYRNKLNNSFLTGHHIAHQIVKNWSVYQTLLLEKTRGTLIHTIHSDNPISDSSSSSSLSLQSSSSSESADPNYLSDILTACLTRDRQMDLALLAPCPFDVCMGQAWIEWKQSWIKLQASYTNPHTCARTSARANTHTNSFSNKFTTNVYQNKSNKTNHSNKFN